MSTKIRPKLSLKNKFYISKERYLELKHFCLQYNEWNKEIASLRMIRPIKLDRLPSHNVGDPTGDVAVKIAVLTKRIDVLKEAAMHLDPYISDYIFEAVTQDRTFEYFQGKGIACGRVYFYERYREFFFHLDKIRE